MAAGLLWIAQHGGMQWPRLRLALPDVRWLWYGAIPILTGFTLIILARRL